MVAARRAEIALCRGGLTGGGAVQFRYGDKYTHPVRGWSDFKSHLTDAPKGPRRASGTGTPAAWHEPAVDSWQCQRQRA